MNIREQFMVTLLKVCHMWHYTVFLKCWQAIFKAYDSTHLKKMEMCKALIFTKVTTAKCSQFFS